MLKKGDKVIVLGENGDVGWNDIMRTMIGKTITVEEVDGTRSFRAEGWWWSVKDVKKVIIPKIMDKDTETFECQCCGTNCDVRDRNHTVSDRMDEEICDDCSNEYDECADCGGLRHEDDLRHLNNYYGSVCPSCEEQYGTCMDCECWVRDGDFYGDRCEECDNEREYDDSERCSGEVIGELGRWADLFIGAEIELLCEDRRDLQDDIRVFNRNKAYDVGFERDYSLPDDTGVEIITPKLKGKAIDNVIGEMCSLITKHYGEVDSSCGLHVHVGSEGLTGNKLVKFAKLMYTCEELLYKLIAPSRASGRWCEPLSSRFKFTDLKGLKGGDFDKVFYGEGHTKKEWEKIYYQDIKEELEMYKRGSLYSPPSWTASSKKKYIKQEIERLEAKNNDKGFERYYKQRKKDEEQQIKRHKTNKEGKGRYLGTNLQSHFFRKTVEFRYHSGTVNKKKILNWIFLCQRLVEKAIQGFKDTDLLYMVSIKDDLERMQYFFRFLALPREIREYFIERYNGFKEERPPRPVDTEGMTIYDTIEVPSRPTRVSDRPEQ